MNHRFPTLFALGTAALLCLPQAQAQDWHAVGTGTNTNGPNGVPCPFGDIYAGQRAQYIYLASELTAAGLQAGDNIVSIRWVVTALNGIHFDIPEPVRRIQCMIAPTQNGGIYYTGPSDDFSRPGRMWWSVPPGVEEFNTWREKTTVYHEGVPGHHLQIGQAVYNRDQLNLWRRLVCWVSGHGEGWALYAERLMEEFGYMDDLGDELGLLDGQRMRATRVVLDIGVHLGKPAPQRWGGGTWDAEKAWELLRANVNMDEQFLRFELNRYLGWPGQAPSYKIGQRLWEQLRAEAQQQAGDAFSLKDFHTEALNLGSLPLGVLRDAVLAD